MFLRGWIILLAVLSSTAAGAYPRQGDFVEMKSISNYREYRGELLNKGYDPRTKNWEIEAKLYDGVTGDLINIRTSFVKADELVSRSLVKKTMQLCEVKGGALEQIDVPAGAFKTCRMDSAEGTVWVGDVPFGVVKQITKTATSELVSFGQINSKTE